MINCFAPEYLTQKIGSGALAPYSAVIRSEVDGDYYVDIVAPIEQEKLLYQDVVLEIVTQSGSIQPFRVGNVVKTGFKIKAEARHIAYDLQNFVFTSINPSEQAHPAYWYKDQLVASGNLPLSLFVDQTLSGETRAFRLQNMSVWDALLVICEEFGAHIIRSGLNVTITKNIGADRGLLLQYGVNIKSFTLTEDYSSVCTKILPIGKEEGVYISGYYLTSSTQYDRPYTKVVQFAQDNINEEDYPDRAAYEAALKADLTAKGNAYLARYDKPKLNYSVDAYVDTSVVGIGDKVKVRYTPLDIEFETSVLSVDWNAVGELYEKIEFGSKMNNIKGLYRRLGGDKQ